MNYSYSKDFRIKSSRQYQQVLERGKGIRGKYIVVHAHIVPNYPFTKLGVAASKKYGKAIARNRFKRITREAFRKVRSSFPQGMQLIVRPRKAALEANMHNVLDELLEISGKFVEGSKEQKKTAPISSEAGSDK